MLPDGTIVERFADAAGKPLAPHDAGPRTLHPGPTLFARDRVPLTACSAVDAARGCPLAAARLLVV